MSSDRIESGRIYFLGAGFSASGGLPLTNKLLPAAARLLSQESKGLFERISNYAAEVDVDLTGQPDAKEFARLCTHLDFQELREYAGSQRWSADGSRERLALKFFLSKAIALATPNTTPPHIRSFVRRLRPVDIVVSFNWDLLLEKALQAEGMRFSQVWREGLLQVMHLHGAVNWIANEPRPMLNDAPSFEYLPLGIRNELVEIEIYHSSLLYEHDGWRSARCLTHGVSPFIVLPGYGKAVDVRLLSLLWYRPEALAIRSGGISIIGLSVSDDDFLMQSLFRYLFRSNFSSNIEVRLLNPDKSVLSAFNTLAGKRRINFRPQCFDAKSINFATFQ